MSFLRRIAPPHILLVAAVPFLGYALAFAYERGYTGRYGIPTWMTRVTLMQALIASVAAALLVAVAPVVARAFYRAASNWIARIVLAPAAALAVAIWAASETEWVMGKHLIIPVVLIAVFGGFAAMRIYHSVIKPLMAQGGSWAERLKMNALRGGQPHGSAALGWMGERLRWTLVVVVVGLVGAYWYGNYKSRSQRSFLVSSSSPTCVAVRRTPDGILCAMTDLTRRRVMPRLRVLPPQAKENLTIATLSPLRSPFDADRKLFRPRATGTTGTVYSPREDAPVTQAGKPRPTTTAKRPTTTAKRSTATTTKRRPATTTTKKTTRR